MGRLGRRGLGRQLLKRGWLEWSLLRRHCWQRWQRCLIGRGLMDRFLVNRRLLLVTAMRWRRLVLRLFWQVLTRRRLRLGRKVLVEGRGRLLLVLDRGDLMLVLLGVLLVLGCFLLVLGEVWLRSYGVRRYGLRWLLRILRCRRFLPNLRRGRLLEILGCGRCVIAGRSGRGFRQRRGCCNRSRWRGLLCLRGMDRRDWRRLQVLDNGCSGRHSGARRFGLVLRLGW